MIVNAGCIIGIIYCIAVMVFIKQDCEIIDVKEVDDDNYVITVKRLWKVYKYHTDHNLTVDDVNNGIRFKLKKKEKVL